MPDIEQMLKILQYWINKWINPLSLFFFIFIIPFVQHAYLLHSLYIHYDFKLYKCNKKMIIIGYTKTFVIICIRSIFLNIYLFYCYIVGKITNFHLLIFWIFSFAIVILQKSLNFKLRVFVLDQYLFNTNIIEQICITINSMFAIYIQARLYIDISDRWNIYKI